MSLSIGAGMTCRDNGRTCVLHPVGRVVIAQALRACGPVGPHGFESHSRRHLGLFSKMSIFYGYLCRLRPKHNYCARM
jgi:hypothetical protein